LQLCLHHLSREELRWRQLCRHLRELQRGAAHVPPLPLQARPNIQEQQHGVRQVDPLRTHLRCVALPLGPYLSFRAFLCLTGKRCPARSFPRTDGPDERTAGARRGSPRR
jgi:hypothetical protein